MKTLLIITGSSKGIGKGLADHALKDDENHVIGISRSHSIDHKNYEAISFDLSQVAHLEQQAEQFLEAGKHYERVVLINNAGTLGDVQYVGKIAPASIAQLFNLNVTAPVLLMNAFIKHYRDFKGQKIILNISSGAGKKPVDGWSGYCASKAALDMASKVAAREAELDHNGFIIKAIAPGVVDTKMQDQIRTSSKSSFSNLEKFVKLKQDGQLLSGDEVAKLIFKIINSIDTYPDVLLDVRNL